MSSYVVGLTGGIGSGKSSVAGLFAELGISVIDTDAIAHELTGPGGAAIAQIRERFGDGFIDGRGALDRGRMRAHAFSDPAARKQLEALLHPLIRAESAARVAASSSPYVILMVPLLVESGQARLRERYRRVLVVDCPEPVQFERVIKRSGLDEEELRRIMAAQVSRADRLAAADDVIDNGGLPESLPPQVERLHRKYLELAAAGRN